MMVYEDSPCCTCLRKSKGLPNIQDGMGVEHFTCDPIFISHVYDSNWIMPTVTAGNAKCLPVPGGEYGTSPSAVCSSLYKDGQGVETKLQL